MSVKKSSEKRVPVLIDRELYEKYKQYAATAGKQPVSVAAVVRYALKEWISVVSVDEEVQDTMDVLHETLNNVIPFPSLRDAEMGRIMKMRLQDMN